MAASAQVTVTAYAGPGELNTAAVFTNVTSFTVDVAGQVLTLFFSGSTFKTFDLSTITTFTATLAAAAGNWTVAVS